MSKYQLDLVQQYYPGAIMFEPMKYWQLSDSQKKKYNIADIVNNGEYFGQKKLDGNWYAFVKGIGGEKYLFSRNESVKTKLLTEKIENVPHIAKALDCLPNGTVLIGEIYVPGGDSNATRRIMGCLPQKALERQQEEGWVHYYIFDCVAFDGETFFNEGSWDRWIKTKDIYNLYNLSEYDFLELAETIETDLYSKAMEYLSKDEEGMVVKKKTAPYTPGKKPAWSSIKIKKEDSADVVCMGYLPPSKEYEGKEIDTWSYWLIQEKVDNEWKDKGFTHKKFEKDEETENKRTIPITKYYYHNMAGSMIVGAFDDKGNLKEIGTVSSGLTDELRSALVNETEKFINKVVKVDMMEKYYDTQTIRQPIFKGFHADKNPYECLLEDIFNK